MTDTGGDDVVDEIVVVGQRRRPGGTFPPAPSPAGGGGGGDGGVNQNELDPDWQPPLDVPHPCDNPDTALPWNADAAGTSSVPEFRNAAGQLGFADAPNGTPSLSNREFGRGLARGPNGSVFGGAVSWGPPVAPGTVGTLTIDFTGIDASNYLGDAHSHPNGNSLPSAVDWSTFVANNNRARSIGRTNETYYMYIFAVNPDGVTGTNYVYQDGPRAVGSPDPPRPTTVGPEVNPNAQPC